MRKAIQSGRGTPGSCLELIATSASCLRLQFCLDRRRHCGRGGQSVLAAVAVASRGWWKSVGRRLQARILCGGAVNVLVDQMVVGEN
jgi:hypothetical protein